jgi:hypothetical protein
LKKMMKPLPAKAGISDREVREGRERGQSA